MKNAKMTKMTEIRRKKYNNSVVSPDNILLLPVSRGDKIVSRTHILL